MMNDRKPAGVFSGIFKLAAVIMAGGLVGWYSKKMMDERSARRVSGSPQRSNADNDEAWTQAVLKTYAMRAGAQAPKDDDLAP